MEVVDQENFEAMLSEDLKKILDEVKIELLAIDPTLKDLTALTELNPDIIEKFCDRNDLTVSLDFKKQLITPFAISKYLSLIIQQKDLVKQLENTLTNLLSKDKVSWVIHQNFTNTITFTKVLPINSDEKPQSLLVKYRINPENEKIIYTIAAGNWGWDITALQLKALLEDTDVSLVKSDINKQLVYSITEKNITINAGEIEVIVKKI